MTEEKKIQKTFHTKGVLILIFFNFVSSLPTAFSEYHSNIDTGHIIFVGTFIFGSLGGIFFCAIVSLITAFLVNKFKFNKSTFYKLFFYLMFLPILVNIIDYIQL